MIRSISGVSCLAVEAIIILIAWLLPAAAFAQSASLPLPGEQGDPITLVAIETSPPLPADADIPPTDLTPVRLPERGGAFGNLQTEMLYRLPARLFFNLNVENTIRLETNIFQTLTQPQADLIYRVLPNVTLGYALNKQTRLACNYFFLRDQYARFANLMSRNFHSIGFRLDRDIPVTDRTVATTGIFLRELITQRQDGTSQELSDIIPTLVVVRQTGRRGVIYASVLGQFRFQNVLERWQEGDQFYSLGGVYRKGRWLARADHTLVTNFGKKALRGGSNNQIFILTYELARQVHPRLPLAVFVRAEPIFNMGANNSPGFAGVNFRIFGGIRLEMNKPAIFPVKFQHS